MLRAYLKSYGEKSTVHGVAYIGNSRSHIVERIFWAVSLIVSLIFTGLWLSKLVVKQMNTPFVVVLDDTPVHVSEINFPSMTICPGFCPLVDSFNYNQFVNGIKSGKMDQTNFTQLELERLQVFSLITRDDFLANFLAKFNLSTSTENFFERLDDFLNFFGNSFDGGAIQDNANWVNRFQVNYTQVIGQNGLCFTFNFPTPEKFFNVKQLSSDFNYNKSVWIMGANQRKKYTEHDYPLKTSRAVLGIFAKISAQRVYTINKKKVQFFSLNIEGGFHLTFHDPYEIVSRNSSNYFAIENSTTSFTISPNILENDESVEDFNAKQRDCFLPEEKSLKYFKVYNKINCEHECLANLTLATCKCVQFWMLREESTRICGVSDWKCFEKTEENFSQSKSICSCLDPCKRHRFEVESKITDYSEDIVAYRGSVIEVKFKDDEFYKLIFKRLYSTVDIIAFTGGLLGLFAGLSALSVIEVIYFFSLRVLLNQSTKVSPDRDQNDSQNEAKSFWKNFMEQSSVHGFYFIVTENGKLMKIFWIFALGLSMFGFYSMSSSSYQRFSSKIVSVRQDSNPINVNEIPFPAITISGDFEHSYFKLTSQFYFLAVLGYDVCPDCFERFFKLQTMIEMFVCRETYFEEFENNRFNYSKNSDFVDMLMNLTSNTQKLWIDEGNATWQGKLGPEYIYPSETFLISGIGFTYNAFEADEVYNSEIVSDDFFHIQKKRKNNNSTVHVPWRTAFSVKNNFKISLKNNTHLVEKLGVNYKCREASFLIHSPYEIPLNVKDTQFTRLGYGTSMDV